MEKKDPGIFRDLGNGSEWDLALQGRKCPRIPGTDICIITHLKWENSSIKDLNPMECKLKLGNGVPIHVLNLRCNFWSGNRAFPDLGCQK